MATPDFITALRRKIGHDELWLSGVTAVVMRRGADGTEILLVRRADNDQWTNVTGIIDPGEQPADAAEREVLEEAGTVAVAERLAWVHTHPPVQWPNGDKAQFLDLVFACRYVSGEAHPADGENTEARWFALGDMPRMALTQLERIDVVLGGNAAAKFERGGATP
ncbi:NUDIX domain-containing protein [Microbacterium sp. MPKO10]|uniref:NUDIX hydrolase n=1 Tax=Microbacterium sp. MPKO10 TaxID=2989818 RepID=UPI0022359E45|nr:NUDIX domain-containing protein [Microbacterium sp. MPKO10]MCW4458922.1 NUDIX domain-containing protein [Microbacterium sp. MPKO10]